MPDPINPKLSGPELLELISQQNPHLTREEILAIASAAGFDLMELQRNPNSPPATGSRPGRERPADPQ